LYTKKTLVKRFHWYGWFICCLAALFYCYEYLLRIQPSVMEVQLRHHFLGLSASGFGLLSSMYYWAYTPMQVVVGVMTDRYGPKRVLTLAILLCALGTYIFGATQDVYIAAFGRFMVGCGSSFAFVGVLKLAAMWLPEDHFPLFAGITTSLGMLGALTGDIAMTWMVHNFGWQHVIMWSVVAGVVLIPIFFLFVQEKIIHEPFHKPRDGFKVYFSRFWVLLKNRDMLITGVIGCLMYLSLSAFGEMWGIPFLQRVMPDQHLAASTLNSMVFLGWLVGGPLSGALSQLFQTRRKMLLIGSVGATVVFTFILVNPFVSTLTMALLLFVFGVFCSVQILCFAVARDYVDVKSAATATGVINMLVMVSGMLLQPLMSRMLDWAWSGQMMHGLRVYSVHDYRVAMAIMPVAMLISAVLALVMKESYKPGSHL
jgi:MFS family permease